MRHHIHSRANNTRFRMEITILNSIDDDYLTIYPSLSHTGFGGCWGKLTGCVDVLIKNLLVNSYIIMLYFVTTWSRLPAGPNPKANHE